jgi:ditrans,polycis-polyprenyl diphosphate synthase
MRAILARSYALVSYVKAIVIGLLNSLTCFLVSFKAFPLLQTLRRSVFGVCSNDVVELSWFERKVFLPILRFSRIPHHAAFIMDGNRRFARNLNEPSLVGHRLGYDRLRRVLLWCYELGMKEVSVYVFSVDNFSRTPEEVGYLMDLAESKLEYLCEDSGFVMTQRIRVKICGDKSLLRPSLQAVIKKLESKTADHEGGIFNVLLAYSSRRELAQAVERTMHATPKQEVRWEHIASNLYTQTPVDVIVRTSGETRLSDFLLWQLKADDTVIVFVKHLWPEYSLVDLATTLLRYHYS